MAAWRTKAYSVFGLKLGQYSYAQGKRELFADLVEWARAAVRDEEEETLRRIAEYVSWAASQNSDELASVVDLAFFFPVLSDPALCSAFERFLTPQLLAEKRRLLTELPPQPE